jgi:hypothetical protein
MSATCAAGASVPLIFSSAAAKVKRLEGPQVVAMTVRSELEGQFQQSQRPRRTE